MMGKRFWIAFFMLVCALVIAIGLAGEPTDKPESLSQLVKVAPVEAEGFSQADAPRVFNFPEDHGPHPDFQTEWWYYTGNLEAPDGGRFGYQLTFFRRALLPPDEIPDRSSSWAVSQVYMAHFAITDASGKSHRAFERLARGAAGLAGAQADPFSVWLEDWRVEAISAASDSCVSIQVNPCVYRLTAAQEDLRLELMLVDQKGPILQGDVGLSQKGDEAGQASYYYSLTRLESSGVLQVDGKSYPVNGWSWMDHEFSTSALSQEQVGWDWFSMQFDDSSELMLFQIRRSDGSIDPYSSGAIIRPDATTGHLESMDFQIRVEDTWESPRSEAVYPARWLIQIPSQGLSLEIKPILADQELNVSYAYWEGAVEISGTRNGDLVKGRGYVELTGYSRSMGGEF